MGCSPIKASAATYPLLVGIQRLQRLHYEAELHIVISLMRCMIKRSSATPGRVSSAYLEGSSNNRRAPCGTQPAFLHAFTFVHVTGVLGGALLGPERKLRGTRNAAVQLYPGARAHLRVRSLTGPCADNEGGGPNVASAHASPTACSPHQ